MIENTISAKVLVIVQIPLPRKGTETPRFPFRFQELYPVQIPLPRKGTETIKLTECRGKFNVQIPLPRKGTETFWSRGT